MKIYNVVKIPQGLGYDQFDYEEVWQSGYTAGYESGYTDGQNDCPEPDYRNMPLTFEILSAGTIYWHSNVAQTGFQKTIQYSLNGGEWTEYTSSIQATGAPIEVQVGDIVRFIGNNDGYGIPNGSQATTFGGTTACFNLYGNIMSLIDSDNYQNLTELPSGTSNNFYTIFNKCKVYDCSNLVLPALVLTNYCYAAMFFSCSTLTQAPQLPATNLAEGCYKDMFSTCTSLTTAPELRATTLVKGCYNLMFHLCASISYVKCLAVDLAENTTSRWLEDASSTGTFIKAAGVEWPRGTNGIPDNWTIEEE